MCILLLDISDFLGCSGDNVVTGSKITFPELWYMLVPDGVGDVTGVEDQLQQYQLLYDVSSGLYTYQDKQYYTLGTCYSTDSSSPMNSLPQMLHGYLGVFRPVLSCQSDEFHNRRWIIQAR